MAGALVMTNARVAGGRRVAAPRKVRMRWLTPTQGIGLFVGDLDVKQRGKLVTRWNSCICGLCVVSTTYTNSQDSVLF